MSVKSGVYRYLVLVTIAAGLLWTGLATQTLWPDWRWESEPFHSTEGVDSLGHRCCFRVVRGLDVVGECHF